MESIKLILKDNLTKLFFWKNKKLNGNIDYLNTYSIKGWFKGINNSTEIQLRINNVVILKTFANEYRKDVCKKLRCEGNFGFSFELNKEFNDLEIKNVAIVAKNSNDKYEELVYKKNASYTKRLIKSIFTNKLYGIDGHIDEINEDNIITGWASNYLKEEPISIWLHSAKKKNKPKEVICNNQRNDLSQKNIKINSGFVFDLNLEKTYEINEILFFTFDQKGLLKIPCENVIKIREKKSYKDIEIINKKKDIYSDLFFQNKIIQSDMYLKKNWENLKIIANNINTLDEFINQEISAKSKENVFSRFLKRLKKK